ncbi:MAG TPA: CsbD family protein [Terriglobales bacterium]
MDEDRIKGKMKDIKGRVERQAGEWTGDEEAQAKGTLDQAKGKAQNAFGKAKDAARDAADNLRERDAEDRSIRRKEDDAA